MTSILLYLCTRHHLSTSVPECLREINRDSRSTKHTCVVIESRSGMRNTSLSELHSACLRCRTVACLFLLSWQKCHDTMHYASGPAVSETSMTAHKYNIEHQAWIHVIMLCCVWISRTALLCTQQTQIKPATSTMSIFNQGARKLRKVNPNVFISVWLIKKWTNKLFIFNLSSLKLFINSE